MIVRVRIKYAVLGLPSLTGSCARGADPIGAFGLVGQAVTNRYHGLACAGGCRLVGLDPVTNPYQAADLLGPRRAVPLPTSTTATRGQGIDSHIVTGRQHQVAGWHRVIAVDNGAEPRGTLDVGGDGGTRWWSVRRRKSFFNQAGRLVNLCLWW